MLVQDRRPCCSAKCGTHHPLILESTVSNARVLPDAMMTVMLFSALMLLPVFGTEAEAVVTNNQLSDGLGHNLFSRPEKVTQRQMVIYGLCVQGLVRVRKGRRTITIDFQKRVSRSENFKMMMSSVGVLCLLDSGQIAAHARYCDSFFWVEVRPWTFCAGKQAVGGGEWSELTKKPSGLQQGHYVRWRFGVRCSDAENIMVLLLELSLAQCGC